jgi:hypothetical protein
MRQIIHIFLKDARRSWLYIAVVAAMTAMLAALTPLWRPTDFVGRGPVNFVVDTLETLLPAVWWFTIAHVIHGESLVGDRQFWITRPYSWKCLVAAKLLFCVVFLALPFLISDCIILSVEGFSPATLWTSLLLRQCQMASAFLMPALLLAALTRGLRQFIPGLLIVVFAELSNAPAPILVTAALAVLLWQYARRQTGYARAVVIVLLVSLTKWPESSPALPAHAMENPEIQVHFEPKRHFDDGPRGPVPQTLGVYLPIGLTGRDRQLLDFYVELAEVTHGRDRFVAQAGPFGENALTAKARTDWVSLWLPRDEYNRLNGEPATVHLVFGIVLYDVQESATLRQWDEWTVLRDFGAVSLHHEPVTTLWLRFPLRDPSTKLTATMLDSGSRVTGRLDWSPTYPPPTMLHITPVVCYEEPFFWGALPNDFSSAVVNVERPVKVIRRDLWIENVRLTEYGR